MQNTFILRAGGVAALVLGLAACDPNMQTGLSPDAQRAAGGAVAGAVVAKALGENVATGAAVGATAGALCDDFSVCQRRY
ncbi:hypothetical protein [Paracoccus sp. (in: a-proteobacteria)]|uniref:hypothetical protein n=1 Tax=Paracoccus sp. TaxID=267 RepID=UPI0026E034DB|nr:hypothetical protein [Paracoccus sp. (in: a-proteobacteria)]MDO5647649.1 hypothetical protein [Paracoccus sp. (in: a-proteobacteria)]